MAIPTIVTPIGAAASGTGAITPAFPSGYTATADDIAITFRECDNADTATVPSGWALVTQQGVASGTTTKLSAIWRRIQAGDTAPQLADAGNHQVARMIVVRGCVTSGNPWDLFDVSTELVSDTSVSIRSVTTTVADTLVLVAFSTGRDLASTAEASAWANTNFANPSIAEQMDNWTDAGTGAGGGGGFAMATGGKAGAGATGATTATVALANFKAMMTIALKPATETSPAPATIATVAAVPAVTVRISAAISPNTIIATAALPAVTVSGSATATPATIAAVAAIPAVTVTTAPQAFRAAATATTGTGAAVDALTVTVPTTGPGGDVVAGDLAYLFWSEVSGGLVTGAATPGGWTEDHAPQAINASTQAVALAHKVLQAGDIGQPVGFGTLSLNRRQNLSVHIYSNAAHDSVTTLSTSATGTTTPPVPGIDPTAVDCLLVSFAAPQHPAANTALITSTPATSPVWTERSDFGTSSAASINHGSQEIQDRQESGGGAFSATTFTTSHSAQYGAVTVAVAAGVSFPTPATIVATAAVPAVTVSAGGTVTAATIAATAGVGAPTVATGGTVTAATVAAAAAIPAPTVQAGSTVTPVTVAATAAVPGPTLHAGATPTPATVAATAAVPAPSIRVGSTVSVTSIAAIATIPAPSISAGGSATVNAATVTATAALGTVTVQASSTVSPATIAALAALPPPSVTAGSTIQVGTIAAAVVIPTPVTAQAVYGRASFGTGTTSRSTVGVAAGPTGRPGGS